MKLSTFGMVFVLAFGAIGLVQAETPQVNNAFHCNKIQDPKKQDKCRKGRAGNQYCRDSSKCSFKSGSLTETMTAFHPSSGTWLDVFTCSDEDVARRVGYTCDKFPWYNGGYPILVGGLDMDDEWEEYSCLEHSEDNTICLTWSSHEDSPAEYELGTYECTEVRETGPQNVSYCFTWKSKQRETKKCQFADGCEPDCDTPTFCRKECCVDGDCYDCSYAPETEWEFSTAECLKVNEKGACLEWKQEEFDEHNFHFREFEEYSCVELSTNEKYCQKWVGDIDSEEEFEFSTCQCLDEDNGDPAKSFCQKWTCYETGYSYFFPNFIWVLLPIGLATLFLPCCVGFIRKVEFVKKDQPEFGFWLLFNYGFIVISGIVVVAHLAGFVGVLISAGTVLVLYPGALYIYHRHVTKDQTQSKKPESTSIINPWGHLDQNEFEQSPVYEQEDVDIPMAQVVSIEGPALASAQIEPKSFQLSNP